MKRGGLFILLFSLCVFVISVASAEIFIEQPNALYSVGDQFNINIAVVSGTNAIDSLVVKIICSGNETDLYMYPLNVKANIQKSVEISTLLDRKVIGSSSGECSIKVNYNGESAESQKFEISNSIDVKIRIEGIRFVPGDNVVVRGSAVKKNGEELNGYVKISVDSIGLNITDNVVNGSFETNFSVPGKTGPGDYELNVKAYEKLNDEVASEGETKESIKIGQTANGLNIQFEKTMINPGEELKFKIYEYDQINGSVEDDIGIKIYTPGNEINEERLVKANSDNSFVTGENYAPGYWKLEARSSNSGLTNEKIFFIESIQKAEFSIVNGSLYVLNKGNVPYNRTISILIGNKTKLIDMDVKVGETERVRLSGEGNNSVSVNDGASSVDLGTVELNSGLFAGGTGMAISDIVDGKGNLFAWAIVILILAGIAAYYYIKVRKSNYYGKETKNEPIRVKAGSIVAGDSAENIIESGKKEACSIVVLKIKNWEAVRNVVFAQEALNRVIEMARKAGARTKIEGNYRIMVLSKEITGQEENTLNSISLEKEVLDYLQGYNTKYSQKIKFGLGAHIGDLIVENRKEFRFTGSGSTLAIAKRVAENSNNEALMSEPMRRRTVSNVKVERLNNGFFRVYAIKNRERHIGFVQGFLNRQKEEGKK